MCRAFAGPRREKNGFLVDTSAAIIRAAAPPLSALRALCGGKLFMKNLTSRKSIRSHKILTGNHTFRTKIQKVMYLVNFRKCYSQTPTSSLIFKPITKLVTTFFHVNIYYKAYLLTYLSLKEFKDHFWFPSVRPSVRPSTRTIKDFGDKKKASVKWCFWYLSFHYWRDLIKIKRNQMDPSGSAFAHSLRGIK